MPRKQNTAAQRAREAQQKTGGKYTALLREAEPGGPPRVFLFRDLLAECSSLPQASVDWGYHPDYEHAGPRMFNSALIGGPVPYGTVLALAGALSGVDLDVELQLESHSSLESATVSCGGRRFSLILSQDLLYELCRTPGCCRHPVDEYAIPQCADHLVECSAQSLFEMAREWGFTRHQAHDGTPGGAGVSVEGELLVRAAVARGTFPKVSTALIEACFEDPNLIDEVYSDEADAMAVRHGMDRELLRLTRVAEAEAAQIRKAAGGSCEACGKGLSRPWGDWVVPPQFCSANCAPTPPPSSREPASPWGAPEDLGSVDPG